MEAGLDCIVILIQEQETKGRGDADGAATVDCRWNQRPPL
jgi:hypothetical protein